MKNIPIFLVLLCGCNSLMLPPSSEINTAIKSSSQVRGIYFDIEKMHNDKFPNDKFIKIVKISNQSRKPQPQALADMVFEIWAVESVSGKKFDYSVVVTLGWSNNPLGSFTGASVLLVNGELLR